MPSIDGWTSTVGYVLSVVREEDVSLLAAGFAHYVFTSLLPLALLVVVGLSIAGELAVLTRTVESLTGVRSQEFHRLLRVTTNELPARRRAALLAGILLAWSSFRLFVAVDGAFSIVYEGRADASHLRTIVQAGYVLVTILSAVTVLIALGLAMAFVLQGRNLLLAPLFFFGTLVVVFFPIFYVFPGGTISPVETLPGTVVTALFWAASGLGFRFYASASPSTHLYGAIGGLLLVLTWVYLGGMVMIVGIILNGVLADVATVDAG